MPRSITSPNEYPERELTHTIIGAAIEVHRVLGPGLLEAAYESCLAHEFLCRGIAFQRQLDFPVVYKDHVVDCGFRTDFLVENLVVVELKAVDRIIPVHQAQLMTYLRLSGKSVGLLINFNSKVLVDGVKRIVL